MKKQMRMLFVVLLLCFGGTVRSQQLLTRNITLDVREQRLDQVLEIMSNKGNFYFSYNSNIVRKDSLVSLSASGTVNEILKQLFPEHFEFLESGNYIIIRRQPIRVKLSTGKAVSDNKFYYITGYVLDEATAAWIADATVYEKHVLASAMTDDNGYFKLKLKQKSKRAALTVSKEFYEDTSFAIDPGKSQEISVTLVPLQTAYVTVIGPEDYFAPESLKLRVRNADSSFTDYTYTKTDSVKVERTRMGYLLLSSRQRIQSMNLRKFFTTRPFQVSMTPGLGTHGKMSAQVVNHFSLNVLGGYNGGVKGVEVGGLFNIDKKDVSFFQAAGVFNIVGGKMTGFQVAGVSNTVLDTTKGFQVAGVNNIVKGKFEGFQVGGVYNHVTDSFKGVQLAGVGNFTRKTVSGVQIAGVVNYAKHVKGTQIGLINISDTAEGVNIGLINIVLKGYHKLSFYADEVVNANAAFKTGTRKLYNILHAGMNFSDSNEVFTFGYGLGTEIRIGKAVSVNPELTAQHLYLGSWNFSNILSKARVNINVNLGRYVSLFGGPVYNVYYSQQQQHFAGYRKAVPPGGYRVHHFSGNVKGWLGWNAGISFF